jgi:hypothetical protein
MGDWTDDILSSVLGGPQELAAAALGKEVAADRKTKTPIKLAPKWLQKITPKVQGVENQGFINPVTGSINVYSDANKIGNMTPQELNVLGHEKAHKQTSGVDAAAALKRMAAQDADTRRLLVGAQQRMAGGFNYSKDKIPEEIVARLLGDPSSAENAAIFGDSAQAMKARSVLQRILAE